MALGGCPSLLLCVLLACAVPASASTVRLFVDAVHGSDSGNGTAAAPFATLGRAAAALRALQPLEAGAAVSVAAGDYVSPDAGPVLSLSAADSGLLGAPIAYVAEPGARLLGGVSIPPAAWTPYAGGVLQADLAALGVTDFGTLLAGGLGTCTTNFSELVHNGLPQVVARYPNIADTGLWQWMNILNGSGSAEFEYDGDRVSTWAGVADVFAAGYWSYDWAFSVVRVQRIDPASRLVVGARHTCGVTAD